MVNGAVQLARGWGVSGLAIGLTIVAVGTTLPELAAGVVAARRNLLIAAYAAYVLLRWRIP